MSPAAKRYARFFVLWMAVYSVLVIASSLALDRMGLSGPPAFAASVAPVLPALMGLREFVIFLRSMDEVQARIQSEAILIAAGFVGFASFTWGFAERGVALPEISLIWVLPGLVWTWGIALVFVSRRYR
jgi:hypothetical protein